MLDMFDRREISTFVRAFDFLWAVRCHLHFATGRAEERLSLPEDVCGRVCGGISTTSASRPWRVRMRFRTMRRLMSRFAMPRSEEARMDALSDPSKLGDFDENDPKSLARAMRKMGREMGDEFAGPEFDEAVNEIESDGDIGDDGNTDGD